MTPRAIEEEPPSEATWIIRAKAGERAAFAELYRLHASRLYGQVLMPRLGERAAAEDALADTFRKALEKLPSFEDRGHGLYPWLATLARNRAIDVLRSRGRSRRAIDRLELELMGEPGSSEAPDARLERGGLREEVADVLDQIIPRYRDAIRCRFFRDGERADCAERMGVSVGTFDVVLLRAVRSFRKAWDARLAREEE